MELTLREDDGIHVLEIGGEIDLKGLSILKAGLSKLLRTGKDRIIVDLTSVTSIPSDFVPVVLGVDKVAKELDGVVCICGLEKSIRDDLGADLDAIRNFTTLDKAKSNIEVFSKGGEELPENVVQLLSAKDAEIHALKERISLSDPEETRKLRKEIAFLRDMNSKLEIRVAEQMKQLRLPTNDDAVKAKVKEMEDNLRGFISPSEE